MVLDVSFAARRPWVPRRREFAVWAETAWEGVPGALLDERVLVDIRVVGRVASRRLNGRYRGKDHPTNVLSFSGAGQGPEGWHLGELVICAPVMELEARRLSKARRAHWAHITVHGVLHLLGFDHQRPALARKMEALEVQILDRLGFSNPYA
jgi:probable rRNA maturation factor